MATVGCDMQPIALPGQQVVFGAPFPLAYACATPTADLDLAVRWAAANRDRLIIEAATHGAVLLRGLPLTAAEDFDALVAAFGLTNFTYRDSLSNAVRVNRTERVFTANEAPADVEIYLHHEMAQTPVYPAMLFFFCQQPAETGGATPICRSDLLFEKLREAHPGFARACAAKGLRYTNVMPSDDDPASGMGRSWQSTLSAADRDEAEARLQALGYTWQWQSGGSLRATTPVLPAVRRLPSGRSAFFNQLIAASFGWKDARNDPSKAVTFGDGEPLDPGAVHAAAELAEQLTFDIPWQRGDVALVDNHAAMHGRRPFTGTRRVLASLVTA